MRKGVEGHTLTIVIVLIGALLGFFILYLFLSQTTDEAMNFSQETIAGFKEGICSMLGAAGFLMGC